MLSNLSRGTLMSYTDHSAQHHFMSNTPNDWECLIKKKHFAGEAPGTL